MPELHRAREEALAGLGELSPQVLARALPLRFVPDSGAALAPWPALAVGRLRIVHREDSVIVVTDGLSDPWDPQLHAPAPIESLGYEIALEAPHAALDAADDASIARGWMPAALWAISDWLVSTQFDLRAHLRRFECSTMAVAPVRGLEALAASSGFAGVLLGPRPPSSGVLAVIEGHDVWILALKLLTRDEYEWAMAVDDGTRAVRLAEAFERRGDRHLSWPERASVLPLEDA